MGWIIGLAIVLFLLIAGVYVYNGLVTKRVRCREAWSQIDVQLKRRYDLIPNLVQTVKGYAAHERETLEAVIQARNQALSAATVGEQAQAENFLTGALKQLFAECEAGRYAGSAAVAGGGASLADRALALAKDIERRLR